jgi:hypothetical protein
MIPALGAGGPGFDSRSGPIVFMSRCFAASIAQRQHILGKSMAVVKENVFPSRKEAPRDL